MWSGTAASWVDLHQFLPANFVGSAAVDISTDGVNQVVAGYANRTGGTSAILWRGPLGPTCDPVDFSSDGSLFDPSDIDVFLNVFAEGSCLPPGATCNDIDFNNDGSFFDPCDIDSLSSAKGPARFAASEARAERGEVQSRADRRDGSRGLPAH
jgi:hypothetical protein